MRNYILSAIYSLILTTILIACTSADDNDWHSDYPLLNQYDRTYDFSSIDKEGLKITAQYGEEHPMTSTPDYKKIWGKNCVALCGMRDDKYPWIGIFDGDTHKCIFDYTDKERSFGYTEYGELIEFEKIEFKPFEFIFGDDYFLFSIIYCTDIPLLRAAVGEIDLILCHGDGTYKRRVIYRGNKLSSISCISKISEDIMYTLTVEYLPDYYNQMCTIVFYKIPKLDLIKELNLESNDPSHNLIYSALYESKYNTARFVYLGEDLEKWIAYSASGESIKYVEYSNGHIGDLQQRDLFDKYDGDPSKSPKYSVEYIERLSNKHTLVVTRTNYDGSKNSREVCINISDAGGSISVKN